MDSLPSFSMGRWFALRLTLPASVLSSFVLKLKTLCEAVVGVEHGDADAARTHCHFGLVNSFFTHDVLRKKIVAIVREEFPAHGAEGNALMSVKKWDGQEKYLVYMIKGKHALMYNLNFQSPMPLISEEFYEILKRKWISKTTQQNDYEDWKRSILWPQLIKLDAEQWINFTAVETNKFHQNNFETIVKAASDYACSFSAGYMCPKAKYITKDLVSNYCRFNKHKMYSYYI